MDVLTTIRLNGALGKKFGRVHQFVANSAAEAVRAMCVMIPGFKSELSSSHTRGLAYAVYVGKNNIKGSDLAYPSTGKVIKITPVVQGSKAGGMLQVVLGAALIVAGLVITGGTFGAASPFGSAIIMMGASMVLGGVVAMLSPQQKTNSAASGTSYNFNGATNTIAQGNPVPLLYGELTVGSAVINAGIFAANQV
jgi:predicted phage tail protein